MPIQRVAASDVFARVRPGAPRDQMQRVSANGSLAKINLSLSQMTNRGEDERRRFGSPHPVDEPAHAGDLAYAQRLVDDLKAAAEVGQAMIDDTKKQFPAAVARKAASGAK